MALKEIQTEFPCEYCGIETKNWIELGRGMHLKKIPCCPFCFGMIDSLPQTQKDKMAEAAFLLTRIGDTNKQMVCQNPHP